MSSQFECKRCLLDTTAEEIEFTDTGCTFCDLALANKPNPLLKVFLPKLKTDNEYDVLLGLSGGVDSAMCLHLLVERGIRPLCFSIDNGYNDPKADENILRMVEALKVPFYRYTIDTKKFQEVQSAFIQAGQKNLEIPTDHILMAASYEMAAQYGIKTIISGGNWATESIMPESWGYQPRDLTHIKDVCRKYGITDLTGIPTCGIWKFNYYKWIKGIKIINYLDHFDYNREEAIKLLGEKYGYQNYGEKHCENYFTWWFQNYYLYEKYGIDKRKAHLSSLILSGQMSRQEASHELTKNPVYPTLGIEERVMSIPKQDYQNFKTDERLWKFLTIIVRLLRRLSLR